MKSFLFSRVKNAPPAQRAASQQARRGEPVKLLSIYKQLVVLIHLSYYSIKFFQGWKAELEKIKRGER
jgi:hypothetical protein